MVGGVERSPGQQPLRCKEPLPRLDIRSVRQGPLGPLPLQLPAAGAPAQALPHGPPLRLALRLHSPPAGDAPGGPQVRTRASLLLSCSHRLPSYISISD